MVCVEEIRLGLQYGFRIKSRFLEIIVSQYQVTQVAEYLCAVWIEPIGFFQYIPCFIKPVQHHEYCAEITQCFQIVRP